MSELTNTDIRRDKMTCEIWCTTDPEFTGLYSRIIVALDELLALRQAREAGDEEVERHFGNLRKVFGSTDSMAQSLAADAICFLRQKLQTAREEIERLKEPRRVECRKCGHEMVEVEGQYGCEHCDHEYDTTCECSECFRGRQVAALKSAPGMEEIDAILQDTEKSSEQIESELSALARRLIAALEEVVGLLRWLDEFSDFREFAERCLREYASDSVYGDDQQKARRILEIVVGK